MSATFAVSGSDTWGVSGPDFLSVYIGLALAVYLFATAVLLRSRYRPTGTDQDGREVARSLAPLEVAYLRHGGKAAVLCAVASLRARHLVLAVGKHKLATTRTFPPEGVHPLERAMHEAVRRQVPYKWLANAPEVGTELGAIDARLTGTGLLLPAAHRGWVRMARLSIIAVLGLGVVRVLAGIANSKPVGYLLLTLLGYVVLMVVWLLLKSSWFPRTATGHEVLEHLTKRYVTLAPAHRPSWSAGGAQTAAMSAALFGAAAVYAGDPTFASRLGMSASTYSSGDSAGYPGDSGSGGGGCGSGGGGGCGGGGCGG
jgi:uncharacterized protein (TIGR04222 family)